MGYLEVGVFIVNIVKALLTACLINHSRKRDNMPREITAQHSKRDCQTLFKRVSDNVWIEFRGGCRHHFRGEKKYETTEVCRHKVHYISPDITAFTIAGEFLELMRAGDREAQIYDNIGNYLGTVRAYLREGGIMIDLRPWCRCLREYDHVSSVTVKERKNEQGAAVRSLLRILEGELPARPVHMPREI